MGKTVAGRKKNDSILPGEWRRLVVDPNNPEGSVRRELDSLVTQMHSSGIRYEEAVREFKRQYLREVLIANRGNQCKAAEELGMHRNTLSRAMAELGLDLAEVRAGLKRPPRSERPVYSVFRQGYR